MFFKFIFILSFRHFHKNIKFFLKIYHLKMEAKISARILNLNLNLNSLLVTRQMTLFHQGVRMGGKLVP